MTDRPRIFGETRLGAHWTYKIFKQKYSNILNLTPIYVKETTLERADFTLQLIMFVTVEKGRVLCIIFFLSIFSQLSPRFQANTG